MRRLLIYNLLPTRVVSNTCYVLHSANRNDALRVTN